LIVDKIIVTVNKTKYGAMFDTYHSVFAGGDKIVSFEGVHPLAKRKVVVRDREEYKNRVRREVATYDIEAFDLTPYLEIEDSIICHEFIQDILDKEGIEFKFSDITTRDLSRNAHESMSKFFYLCLYILAIPLIAFFIGKSIGYNSGYEQGYSEGCHTLEECDEKFNIETVWLGEEE